MSLEISQETTQVVPVRGSRSSACRKSTLDIPLLSAADGQMKSDIEDCQDHIHTSALGQKTIHHIGSVVLTVNNVSGAGMLGIPAVFLGAGWFAPLIVFIFILLVSTLSSTLLCDAMARIPGNENFERRIEFSTAFEHYYGKRGYIVAQIGLILCLMSQALSSMVATAQVMDQFLVFMFHKTFAIAFQNGGNVFVEFECTDAMKAAENCVPFADDGHFVLTLGYILTLALIMPMGLMNLEDNIVIQYVSFIMLIAMLGEFIYHFLHRGHVREFYFDDTPIFGTDFSHVLGVIIFNFSYVVTIPSWVNEKKDGVSVCKPLWQSTISSTFGYLLIGLLGAWAYPHATANFLQSLSQESAGTLTRICSYLFSIGIIGLGIPVFCIMTRYNLIVGKVCRPLLAGFWGVAFPWMCAW
eukprot:CAMPEP_0114552744 /NCGR_PEP_ID=MMETSP0114-20121206/7284_1 /TAXON_ID=31324 /ORGANISM="Goniomonas sp, Strain m" /LENGTH=411 /DNA_ID=CAMNT_0001737633 /DNA_START=40 /DNA_END=1272 /DNA_ORIENTATION=+